MLSEDPVCVAEGAICYNTVMHEKRKTLLFAAVAFLLTAALYLPTVRFSFIPLDDFEYVVRNPHAHKGLTWDNVKWALTAVKYDGACEWHPLAWLSEMFDISVSGATGLTEREWESCRNSASVAMHLHNLLLHAAIASLVFLLLLRLSRHPAVRRGDGAAVDPVWLLVLTLFWSLHPLRSEVVCWAAERKELTCTFFMLLTLLAYFRGRHVLAFALCCLAMMAKPMAVTLPVVLLAWDWVYGGKIRFLRTLPFFGLSAATCLLTVCSQEEALDNGCGMPLAERLTTIFGAPVEYVFQTFWPTNLSIYYWLVPGIDWSIFAPGVVLAAGMLALCVWWLVRRSREPAWRNSPADVGVFAISWCYVCLMPMLLLGVEQHWDRYTYWSGIGFVACLAMLLSSCGHAWRQAAVGWVERVDGRSYDWEVWRRNVLYAAVAVLAVLTIATHRRIAVWSQPKAFMQDAVLKSWDGELVNVFTGWILRENPSNLDEAEYWLRECATRNPGIDANFYLAWFLFKMRGIVVSTFDGAESISEPEIILKQILANKPDHKKAKALMKELQECKAKARDKERK